MTIETVTVGPFNVNCLIVADGERRALVFDPGSDANDVAQSIEYNGLEVGGYILTHAHMDHISGLHDLHARYPAPVWMHALDLQWAFSDQNQMPPYYSVPLRPDCTIQEMKDDDQLDVPLTCRIIHTPGHTPGSCCIYFPHEKILIAGDTLFRGSVGRTDFAGGDSRQMKQSLQKLKALPNDTLVYPGHGETTEIGHERQHNIFLRDPA